MYVALWYGYDNVLGRTILARDWPQAVRTCVMIAEENKHPLTQEQYNTLNQDGEVVFENGCAIHIGCLESDIDSEE